MNENIGAVIRKLRKERDITQEELAELLGVTSQAVSKWESGAGLPDISQLVPLANVFEVSMDMLFGRTSWKDDGEVDRLIEEIEAKHVWDGDRLDAFADALRQYPDHKKLLWEVVFYSSLNVPYANGEERQRILDNGLRAADRYLSLFKDVASLSEMITLKVRLLAGGGRYEDAERIAKQYDAKLINDWMLLADIAEAKKDYREEIRCRQEALVRHLLEAAWQTSQMAYAYDNLDQPENGLVCQQVNLSLPALYNREDRFKVPFVNFIGQISGMHAAYFLTKLGRHEEALDLLEYILDACEIQCECAANRDETLNSPLLSGIDLTLFKGKMRVIDHVWKIREPEFEPLHKYERFQKLMERYERYTRE